jgi:hypothetical protein
MAESKEQKQELGNLAGMRAILGVGPEVTDAALRQLIESPQGQKEIAHIASQSRGGGLGSFLSGGLAGLTSTTGRNKALGEIGGFLTDSLKKAPPAPKLPSPEQATGKTAKKEATAAAPSQPSPYEQLANALAGQYLQQINQLEPLISGSGIFGPGQQTEQVAATAEQAVPGASGWLAQQVAAEGQAAKPLQNAMANVGSAYAASAIHYAGAISATGPANTQFLEAAPWQQILSELASETAYKAASSQGAAAFGQTGTNPPPFLQQIFKNLGLATVPGSTATGLSTPTKAATGGTTGSTGATTGGGNPSGPTG